MHQGAAFRRAGAILARAGILAAASGVLLTAAGGLQAQANPPGVDVPAGQEAPFGPAGNLAAVFRELRFEDDWSSTGDPAILGSHWAPELKLIELDEGGEWVVSVGGEARWRTESRRNQALVNGPDQNNSFNLYRLRLHGDLHYRDDLRFFVETISAGISDNNAAPGPADRDSLALLNAFVEFPIEPGLLRLGRTELEYGAGRLIAPNDWQNVPRSFQGGLARFLNGTVTTDVFVTQPVAIEANDPDNAEHSQWFSGIYNTWVASPDDVVDIYGLVYLDSDDEYAQTPMASSPVGDLSLYTVGARYATRIGAFDGELENAWQFGDRAGSSVRALMYSVVTGYTVSDWSMAPRFGFDIDFASGDGRANDDEYETFNQLFPDSHDYFGYLDLVGRQNVNAFRPNLTLQVADTASFLIAYSDLELANTHDYLYDAEGNPTSPTSALNGNGGKDIGQELDLALAWRPPSFAPHGRFLFGYSELHPAKFVDGFGNGKATELYYVQATFVF